MAHSNFQACLDFTFRYEGGFVNHPADPGGATNWGITRNVLAGWRGKPVSVTDVKNMSRSEAADIYRANYWAAVRGDELPLGVDLVVWDYGVNSGPSRAIKSLQSALGVKVDGFIGAATLDAASKFDAKELVDRICNERQRFVRGLKPYKTFGKGWEARIAACRKLARQMAARNRPEPAPTPLEASVARDEPQPKAEGSDERLLNSSTVRAGIGAAASGGGFAIREGVEIARDAVDAGRSASEIAMSVGPWLLLALVTIGFAVYIILHRRKQIRENGE